MSKKSVMAAHEKGGSGKKLRIFWATAYTLLDSSSGAAISMRHMLKELAKLGHEIAILGASVFDSPKGLSQLSPDDIDAIQVRKHELIRINDGPLIHNLFVTNSIARNLMTSGEEGEWYSLYVNTLETFKPDFVFFFGGQILDMHIPSEAKLRGINSVAFLLNGSYQGTRWCKDVDLILTDSQATATYYKEEHGYKNVHPVGVFIDPSRVVSGVNLRKNVLFINPSFEKGVAIVIQLAMILEKKRPDIFFEVVESRGNWQEILKITTKAFGDERESLNNVIVTANTSDMRSVYGRAKVLLAPSLWWESFGMVAAEAMLNGIPAIVTNRGGLPEVIRDAGVLLELDGEYYEKPYQKVPSLVTLQPLVDFIERLYDYEILYNEYVIKAHKVAETVHRANSGIERLLKLLFLTMRRSKKPA